MGPSHCDAGWSAAGSPTDLTQVGTMLLGSAEGNNISVGRGLGKPTAEQKKSLGCAQV